MPGPEIYNKTTEINGLTIQLLLLRIKILRSKIRQCLNKDTKAEDGAIIAMIAIYLVLSMAAKCFLQCTRSPDPH
eukprot:489558-Pelagomonas_calceolata.AAC.1